MNCMGRRQKVSWTDGKWPLSATTSTSKIRLTLAKQQDTRKNEVTSFEEKVHEE